MRNNLHVEAKTTIKYADFGRVWTSSRMVAHEEEPETKHCDKDDDPFIEHQPPKKFGIEDVGNMGHQIEHSAACGAAKASWRPADPWWS